MGKLVSLVLSSFLLSAITAVPTCDNGWTNYKEEQCIKSFEHVATYAEAEEFCSAEGGARGSLVMVKEGEMQEFLVELTEEIFDYIWLGGSYDGQSSKLLWQDGAALTYTNWQAGYPRNITNDDACIEMRPGETRSQENTKGKWAHVTCKKRNLVMCQKPLTWTLNDAVEEILRLRKQVAIDIEDLEAIRGELGETKGHLEETRGELGETIRSLNHTQVELRETRRQVEENRHNLNNTRGDTSDALEEIRAELGETNDRVEETVVDLEGTKAKLNETGSTLEESIRHLAETRAQLAETTTGLGQTNSQVSTISSQLAQTNTQLGQTRTQLTQTTSQLADARSQLTTTRTQLTDVSSKLATLTTRVVPVGSIYVEYYNQASPRTLWPSFTWQDVSGTYAGLFFRVSGGSSGGWGSIQAECAPRITNMQHTEQTGGSYPNSISLPASGWSVYGDAGENVRPASTVWYEALRFNTAGCEVRPRNQAVRIWKRLA